MASDLPRRAIAVVLLVMLGACADGYPSEDRSLTSPHDMDNAGRLRVMNEIGGEAHRSRRWTYALESSCMLRVTAWRGREKAAPVDVALSTSAAAEVRFDREDDTYGVRLQSEGPALLEARRFGTASQFLLLLRLVARDCGS